MKLLFQKMIKLINFEIDFFLYLIILVMETIYKSYLNIFQNVQCFLVLLKFLFIIPLNFFKALILNYKNIKLNNLKVYLYFLIQD